MWDAINVASLSKGMLYAESIAYGLSETNQHEGGLSDSAIRLAFRESITYEYISTIGPSINRRFQTSSANGGGV